MRLLNLPLRFLARQGRWFARGAGIVVAGAVFEFLRNRDALQIPWMAEAYEIGTVEPYWMAVVAYLTTTWFLKRVIRFLVGSASQHIERVSRGEWFKP